MTRPVLSLLVFAALASAGSEAAAQRGAEPGSAGDPYWVGGGRERAPVLFGAPRRGTDDEAERGGEWDAEDVPVFGRPRGGLAGASTSRSERGSIGVVLSAATVGGVRLVLPTSDGQTDYVATGGATVTPLGLVYYDDPGPWQVSAGYMAFVGVVGSSTVTHSGMLCAQYRFDLGGEAGLSLGGALLAGSELGGRLNATYEALVASYLMVMVDVGCRPMSDLDGNVTVYGDIQVRLALRLTDFFCLFFAPRLSASFAPAGDATSLSLNALAGVSLSHAWPL